MKLTKEEFANLRRILHELSGIAIGNEKQYLVEQRLRPIVEMYKFRGFSDLYFKLAHNPDKRLKERVIEAITTNETFFFRDVHPFESFKKLVFPWLGEELKQKKERGLSPRTRIWCAASSTGQEPYTIAMMVYEYCQITRYNPSEFVISATDISGEALAKALQAEYNNLEISRGLDQARRNKYFKKKTENSWVLIEPLQHMVQFRNLNLCQPFQYLGNYEVIFCRNVLIYFDLPTKKKIIDQFYNMLPAGGWLILGSSESMYGINDKFKTVRNGPTIFYRK
ncbi:CheR family methyltransferase [Candidatus Riflebacteria bacterium]